MAATLLCAASVLEVHSRRLRIYSTNCSGFIQLITSVLTYPQSRRYLNRCHNYYYLNNIYTQMWTSVLQRRVRAIKTLSVQTTMDHLVAHAGKDLTGTV